MAGRAPGCRATRRLPSSRLRPTGRYTARACSLTAAFNTWPARQLDLRHAKSVGLVPRDLEPGDRVLVAGLMLRGHQGTLIRRTRLPWNFRSAWIVELDNASAPGGKRQPIGEAILVRLKSLHEPEPE